MTSKRERKEKRPPAPKPATRSESVLVRFKPDERIKIEAAAKARGLATSSWVRMIALDAVTVNTSTAAGAKT